jgi:cobalt-zinc-cadmium efflux system outer membrane protein
MSRFAIAVVVLLAGCASTSPKEAWHDTSADIEKRTGHQVAWDAGGDDDKKTHDAVQRLLARELTVEDAVAAALLASPRLQAQYEEIGVAQADLVQAGLLQNPTLSVGMTTAEREALDPNVVFGLTQELLDVFLIPARKKAARAELERVELAIADAVVETVLHTRSAWYTLVAAQQIASMRALIVEAGEAALDVAVRQHEAGNLSDLDLANERASTLQLETELARSELDVVNAREELARLLGAEGFRVPAKLPELPASEPQVDRLEDRAVNARADLAAARKQVESLDHAISLAKTSRWTGMVEIGADVARLKDGHVVVAPRGAIELPIFDQRTAMIAKLEALDRAAKQTERAIGIDVRSDVRRSRAKVTALRKLADRYATVVVPTRESVVKLSQTHYDAMLLGVYQLLQARQAEVNAWRDWVETLRDYWIARAELERACGGRLPR